MTITNEQLLTEQHREMDLGIGGLVDGSGSRDEFIESIALLRRHIYIEETLLFPLLEQDSRYAMALTQMKYEHSDMWPLLEPALTAARESKPLDDVFEAAQTLMHLLQIHNPKEEEAIYAAADRFIEQAGQDSLEKAFDTTDIPDGWVCEMAR